MWPLRQPGVGWDPRQPLSDDPNVRAKFGSDACGTTIIPTPRRLRQENLEFEASLCHTARPYLKDGLGELSLGLGERVRGTNTVISPRVILRPWNSSQLSERSGRQWWSGSWMRCVTVVRTAALGGRSSWLH